MVIEAKVESPLAYGRALYYPYIHLNDDKWLKTAALYYEGIGRIVPKNHPTTYDSEFVSKLNENKKEDEKFVRNIDPGHYASEIGYDFIRFVERELSNPNYRNDLSKKMNLIDNTPILIHIAKIGPELEKQLPELGLVKKPTSKNNYWYEFEPVVGVLYMTYLANAIAKDFKMPIVTNDPVYGSVINEISNTNYINSKDVGETLASMVINTSIPQNIEAIPISKIIEFRNNYKDERHLFYKEINSLVQDVKSLNNSLALRDCLESKKNDIDIAVKNLDKVFKGLGLTTITGLLGLSIPSFMSGLGAGIATAGVVTVAAATYYKQRLEYHKSKYGSPYSYVLSLKKDLNAQTLAEQLLRGDIVL